MTRGNQRDLARAKNQKKDDVSGYKFAHEQNFLLLPSLHLEHFRFQAHQLGSFFLSAGGDEGPASRLRRPDTTATTREVPSFHKTYICLPDHPQQRCCRITSKTCRQSSRAGFRRPMICLSLSYNCTYLPPQLMLGSLMHLPQCFCPTSFSVL